MKKGHWVSRFLLLLLILAMAAAGYWFWSKPAALNQASAKPALAVTVTPLKYHALPDILTAYATTVSPSSIDVLAATSGVVKKVWVHAGQQVEKGQLLFTLTSSDLNVQLHRLRAQWMLDRRKLELDTRVNHQVPGTVPKYDLLSQRVQVSQDKNAYKLAQQLQRVTAPFSGRIAETVRATGSVVTSGDRLTSLVDDSALYAQYVIPDHYETQVKLKQAVTFSAFHGQRYQGQVSYIAPLHNADDFSLTVRAKLKLTTGLVPNVFGQVKQVINAKRQVLAVEQHRVQADERGFYVYSVDKNSKVVKRYFTPGNITPDGLVEVKAGLAEHDNVIDSDPTDLSAGQVVKVTS